MASKWTWERHESDAGCMLSGTFRNIDRTSLIATLVSTVMIGQQLASKALRDGYFLTHFESVHLPSVMTLASLLSVGAIIASTKIFRHFSPAASVPFFFGISALVYVLEWGLTYISQSAAAFSLYLHTAIFGSVVISGFWAVINERFDPHRAKQVIARIAGGATLGGVLGGLAAWSAASSLSIPTMLLVLAGLNLVCALGLRQVGEAATVRDHEPDEQLSAIQVFQETPFLRQIAFLIALLAFAEAVYDFIFKTQMVAFYGSGPELISFFAVFYLTIGLVTLFVQSLVTRPSLALLGLALTIGTMPASVLLFGAVALLVPGPMTALFLRGGVSVVESSTFRSAYELLYTPLSPAKKRVTKSWVDVGGNKFGTALGAGVAYFVLRIFPNATTEILLSVGIVAGMGAAIVTRRLHRGYVDTLQESLRSGAIALDPEAELDTTTQQAAQETLLVMDRAAVLKSIASTKGRAVEPGEQSRPAKNGGRTRARNRDHLSGPSRRGPFVAPPQDPVSFSELDESIRAIADLRSGNPERIETALQENNPAPYEMIPHMIPLLADNAVGALVGEAICRVAPAHTGLLLDRLLNVRTPIQVRRDLCRILRTVPTERCVAGLTLLLRDPELDLRYSAVVGLLQIFRSAHGLTLEREPYLEAAKAESIRCARRWQERTELPPSLKGGSAFRDESDRRVAHSLAYVIAALLLAFDRDSLIIALRALADGNKAHRGTGLEYLENVLPGDLKSILWPVLCDGVLVREAISEPEEILSEIIETRPLLEVDLATLRARIDENRRIRSMSLSSRSESEGGHESVS